MRASPQSNSCGQANPNPKPTPKPKPNPNPGAGWPTERLVRALRAHMQSASLAICWLLEHRPKLMASAALGPELLLDAIRVVASSQP